MIFEICPERIKSLEKIGKDHESGMPAVILAYFFQCSGNLISLTFDFFARISWRQFQTKQGVYAIINHDNLKQNTLSGLFP